MSTQETEGSKTNARKLEHIQLVSDHMKAVTADSNGFDLIRLAHRAFPEVDFQAIDSAVEFMGRRLSFPLLISSMTGGDHALVRKINRNLAQAAQRTGIGMAVGSQRVMFEHEAARSSFELRQFAPDSLLLANLGAVQLNYGFDLDHCQQAVDLVGADGLYLHTNPAQEVMQPEGNTNFSGLLNKTGAIARQLTVPVIIKEVGCGLSAADLSGLVDQGIEYMDVAGRGGLSWGQIESLRAGKAAEDPFRDWGIPTPLALKQALPYKDSLQLVASGGVRNGLDMAKSVILGARLCGMAAPLLKPAMESVDRVVEKVETVRREFVTAMFLLGVSCVAALRGNTDLILEDFT